MTKLTEYNVEIDKVLRQYGFEWGGKGDAKVVFPKPVNLSLLETIVVPKGYFLEYVKIDEAKGGVLTGTAKLRKEGLFKRQVGWIGKRNEYVPDLKQYCDRNMFVFKESLWPIIVDYGDLDEVWKSNNDDLNTVIEKTFGKRYHA